MYIMYVNKVCKLYVCMYYIDICMFMLDNINVCIMHVYIYIMYVNKVCKLYACTCMYYIDICMFMYVC